MLHISLLKNKFTTLYTVALCQNKVNKYIVEKVHLARKCNNFYTWNFFKFKGNFCLNSQQCGWTFGITILENFKRWNSSFSLHLHNFMARNWMKGWWGKQICFKIKSTGTKVINWGPISKSSWTYLDFRHINKYRICSFFTVLRTKMTVR